MQIILYIIFAAVSYVLGSANTAIILSKIKGTDIRDHGSGNAGTTNTLRTFGKTAAGIVLLGDALKGVVAILLCRLIQFLVFGSLNPVADYIAGTFAVFGHNYPLYFKLKGGKGILTSFAVLLVISPLTALFCFAIFVIVVAITRYISLGSIIGAGCLPFVAFFVMHERIGFVIMGIVLAVSAIFLHRKNIARLRDGTESKFAFNKK